MHQAGLQNPHPWYTAESTTKMAMGSSATPFTPGMFLQFPWKQLTGNNAPPFCPMVLLHTATAKQQCLGRLRNIFKVYCANFCPLVAENLAKIPIPGPSSACRQLMEEFLQRMSGDPLPTSALHCASRFTPAPQQGPFCPPVTGTPSGRFKSDREEGQICAPPVSSQPESLELINKSTVCCLLNTSCTAMWPDELFSQVATFSTIRFPFK